MSGKRIFYCSLLCAAILAGCDLAATVSGPDKDFGLKKFGERCARDIECESTFCLSFSQGDFCTRPCDEGCPDGWSCQMAENPHGEGTVALCTMNEQQLCMPCSQNNSCGNAGSNWCLEIGSSHYCAQDCTFLSCPDGYVCSDVTNEDGIPGRQCLPESGSCVCDARSVGQSRGCEISNEYGTCPGIEICSSDLRWEACNAPTPGEEICNGLDDDCDGFVDEDLDGLSCELTNEFGTCMGTQLCAGIHGLQCYGSEPAAETCNGSDDDCDGFVDEDFRDEDGRYISRHNCGACGQDCDLRMAHAVSTECVIEDGQPVCRALTCEPGYFLYMDGVSCLALPSNLCMSCSQDSDCIGPNSLCIDTGQEAYCGRDCSSTSPYGQDCPSGYECSEVRRGMKQCTPITKSCMCNADNVGSARTCQRDTCVGFEWCQPSSESFVWSSCVIDKYNPEICDGLDNNCNGVIDEGMRDPVTGLYTTREHCGYCFNDCTDYFKPEIHHTEGACIVSAGTASCGMGPCSRETVDGVEYEWVNTDGIFDNGCECRRRLNNLTVDEPDIPGSYASGYDFVDENCDGIDGVAEDALFVSKSAAPNGNGSLAKPYQTISEALRAWNGAGKKYILVAEGIYEEDLLLPDGAVLHGGYSSTFRSRDLVLHASIIRGVQANATVIADGISQRVVISGFDIKGTDRPPLYGGRASVAVWIHETSKVSLYANQISGGLGEAGMDGAAGIAGNGSNEDYALNGGNGQDSARLLGPCINMKQYGGRGGINASCREANATAGGATFCPTYNWETHQGGAGEFSDHSLNRGLGGHDESFDSISGQTCSHATESGYPTNIQSHSGTDGLPGTAGANGKAGKGSLNPFGTIRNGFWVSAETAGNGTNASHGIAGGGGGGGGGAAYFYRDEYDCPYFEIGPSGGGGGAGGCGGQGGKGGNAGGASIGLLITNSSFISELPEIVGNTFARGLGGKGGNGGIGGAGGAGGAGGQGGGPSDWISFKGGKGGQGGQGGRGGGGGGGAGGPSFDVLTFNASAQILLSNNTFIYDNNVQKGGGAGIGGIGGASESGQNGTAGFSAQILNLKSCTNGKCDAGYSCNSDQVCLPNT